MPSRRPVRLSQHFLIDRPIASRIVEAFAPAATDRVVEIGPGRGMLTGLVAGKVASLTAIEIDRGLAARLREHHKKTPGFQVLENDVLRVPLADLATTGKVRLLGNLPYHISSPLVLKLLDESRSFTDAVIMLQAEFADRLAAKPSTKNYASISVLVQTRFVVTSLLTVPQRAFDPPPTVMSRVIRLVPLATPLVEDRHWPVLKMLLRAAFSARRKTLANGLSAGLRRTREEVAEHLRREGLDPQARPETLTPAQWGALAGTGLAPAVDILTD